MKLYYLTGACSQAANIALREAGLKFDLVKVDRLTKKAADGLDFNEVNPKGYVPALTLDSGETLTENVCVLQYIADRNPAAKLAPPYGTMERYRLIEWLAFISSELHRHFGVLFNKDSSEDARRGAIAVLSRRLDYTQRALEFQDLPAGRAVHGRRLFSRGNSRLVGSREARFGQMAGLKRYVDRIRGRPHVVEALKAEGLIK